MMKRFLMILVFGFVLSGNAYAVDPSAEMQNCREMFTIAKAKYQKEENILRKEEKKLLSKKKKLSEEEFERRSNELRKKVLDFANRRGKALDAIGDCAKNARKIKRDEEKIKIASMVEDAKEICEVIGFSEGTDKFTDCALKLYSQSVELAAKSNQQIVGTSSGGSIRIYDPVRDSRALIRQGQRMLRPGGCTLGINC